MNFCPCPLPPLNQLDTFHIEPKVTITSNGLRKYEPHVRNCYFKSERKLRFFKTYRRKNCELECLANFTLRSCDCVRYFMPRDAKTKVCNIFQKFCAEEAEVEIVNIKASKECSCLPDCVSIKYDVIATGISGFEFAEDDEYTIDNITFKARRSEVRVKFKENSFITMIRSESTTMSDFIASIGGLLGFFMGMSVLTIAELIYFFTVRLCMKWRQQTRVRTNIHAWARKSRFSRALKQKRPNRSV